MNASAARGRDETAEAVEREVGRAPAEIEARTVLAVVLGVIILMAAVMWALAPWVQHQGVRMVPPASGPALLTRPATELDQYRAAQKGRLEGYGWVEREAGIARIPVERAIEILSAQTPAAGGQ